MARYDKRGRPARLDPDVIADAVLAIGPSEASMRAVAEYLGVSLPGLYHHVRGRDELLRLAAERTVKKLDWPTYDGQHWATWLAGWATFIRESIGNQPEYLDQFTAAAIQDERQIPVVGEALEVLVSLGLSPSYAMQAWAAVTNLALGNAVEMVRERRLQDEGRPWVARIFTTLARRDAEDFPVLRALAATGDPHTTAEAFDDRVQLLLSGIAQRHGLSLADGSQGRAGGKPAARQGRSFGARPAHAAENM